MGLEDFEVLQPIGKGAFARVDKVKRRADAKVYALKRVDIGALPQKDLQDALNEIRILASFKHPRLIRWYETFIAEDASSSSELCIVMEYCPYGDLEQKIKRHQHRKQYIDEREVWVYAINILEGLAALHAKGVVHRDLKPANCLIDPQGCVKIADMNISKVSKGGNMQTQVGTPYFICPEIYLKRPYSTTSDMWSLGGVLYNLAALHPPFLADNIRDLRKAVVKGTYGPLPSVYGASLATLIGRLLQLNPADRPEAKAVLADPLIERHRYLLLHPLPQGAAAQDAEGEMLPTIKVASDREGVRTIALPGPAYDDHEHGGGDSSPGTPRSPTSVVVVYSPRSSSKQGRSGPPTSSKQGRSGSPTSSSSATATATGGGSSSSSSSSSTGSRASSAGTAAAEASVAASLRRPRPVSGADGGGAGGAAAAVASPSSALFPSAPKPQPQQQPNSPASSKATSFVPKAPPVIDTAAADATAGAGASAAAHAASRSASMPLTWGDTPEEKKEKEKTSLARPLSLPFGGLNMKGMKPSVSPFKSPFGSSPGVTASTASAGEQPQQQPSSAESSPKQQQAARKSPTTLPSFPLPPRPSSTKDRRKPQSPPADLLAWDGFLGAAPGPVGGEGGNGSRAAVAEDNKGGSKRSSIRRILDDMEQRRLTGFVSGTGGSSPHTGAQSTVPLADELKRLFTGHQRSPTGAGGSQQAADGAAANDFDSWARDGGLL